MENDRGQMVFYHKLHVSVVPLNHNAILLGIHASLDHQPRRLPKDRDDTKAVRPTSVAKDAATLGKGRRDKVAGFDDDGLRLPIEEHNSWWRHDNAWS